MNLLASIILALSTNLDNFAVGVAYSFRNTQITWQGNLLIALLSGLSTLAAISIGTWIEQFLPPGRAEALGSGVLMIIGVLTLFQVAKKQLNSAETESDSPDHRRTTTQFLSWQSSLILGLALTITNLGTGVGAGMAHLDLAVTSVCSFFSSLLTVGGGFWLGSWLSQRLSGSRLELVSGTLLIILGLYEYWVA